MSVVEILTRLGGVATTSTLVRLSSRAELEQALAGGQVRRVGRGRYVLPVVADALQEAHSLAGVLSHTSAALAWGWPVKTIPEQPHVTVPHKRKVRRGRRVVLHRRDLTADEIVDGRTSRDLTLEQCLRALPFDEALAVADSALRQGYPAAALRALSRDVRGAGAARVRRVAAHADPRAANPFESGLRAAALSVPGLHTVPQVQIGDARPDLVDVDLRIVLEADSFQWHGGRAQLRRDAHRYNRLVLDGWLVLRFAWEDVMFSPELVHSNLVQAVSLAEERG
jgi:very-short-patch-repair endonuclease